jgi:hypothetical protein
MAYGQIDPARLAGEALTRWYLRSPADVERERQAAAAQNYHDFFGGADCTANQQDGTSIEQSSSDLDGPQSAQEGVGRWGPGGSLEDGVYRPAQDGIEKSAVAANVGNCVGCHQGLPPVPVPLPLVPLFRGTPSFPSSGQPHDDRKQCEMQDRNDRGICYQQPTNRAKAVCNQMATKRREYCDRTGIIGEPNLFTARRKSGRPWP